MRIHTLAAGALAARQATAMLSGPDKGAQKPLESMDRPGKNYYHIDDSEIDRQVAHFDVEKLVGHVLEDAQSPASCATCEALILQLQLIASRGDDFFVHVTTELCKLGGIQDDDVCEGSIALEGPIIAQRLRLMSVGSRTSRLACVAFMGLCSWPDVQPRNISFPSPKPKTRERPKPSGKTPLHVVHYSDIHIDPFYAEGANANCTKPICCRDYPDVNREYYYDIDTVGGNGDPVQPIGYPARRNGEHKCDAPVNLADSMFAVINDIIPDAAFSIFTGDIVDHAVWNTTAAQNTLDILDGYGRMDKAGLLVYGTAGNHEASPANSYPPTSLENNSTQWLYDVLSSTWAQWIGAQAADRTREFGAYTVKYPGGNGKLKVISISTNLYYAHNYWLYEQPMEEDPSGQLAWLVDELDDAESKGERVYVIGHMPMGASDSFHDASNYFDQVVKRYEATIAGMFFGHTHYDEFEISYSDYSNRSSSNALAMSYIAPSMTPTSGYPAFRVYTVDPDTFAVLDATTYIANMSDPAFHTTGPVWTKYYSAKETYGSLVSLSISPESNGAENENGGDNIEELSPAFWHNVTEVLEKNATAFAEYWARRRRGWNVGDCDDECMRTEICKLRASRSQDNCIVPGFKLDILRRQRERVPEPAHGHEDDEECGGSMVRDTLAKAVGDIEMMGYLRWVGRRLGSLPHDG